MKLNLLPAYIRQAKRNRNAFVLMMVLVLATLLGFGYYSMSVKKQLAEAKEQDRRDTQTAKQVVDLAKSADTIYEQNAILFRNVELKWYIEQHNRKYPGLYRKIAQRLPSFVRLGAIGVTGTIDASKGAQPPWPGMGAKPTGRGPSPAPAPRGGPKPVAGPGPAPPAGGGGGGSQILGQAASTSTGDSTVTVAMKARIANFAQYSDVMIALVRKLNKDDDFVVQVSRAGFRQNPGSTDVAELQQLLGRAVAMSVTVDITALVKYNLVPPNPYPALLAAAKGGGGAAAGFGQQAAGGGPPTATGAGGPTMPSPGGAPTGPAGPGSAPGAAGLKGKLQGQRGSGE
jgi:hypothetical protein